MFSKLSLTTTWNVQAKAKYWGTKIKHNKKKGHIKRSQATAIFRLDKGHDLLGDHLEKLKLATSNICKLCNLEKLDRGHLFKCTKLKDFLNTLPNNMNREEKEASL